jgi:hypothetical protein
MPSIESLGTMKTWRIIAGAALLFVGTVASFKCLGEIKRSLLHDAAIQHSVSANLIAWLVFGLLPLILSQRLWRRSRRGDGAEHEVDRPDRPLLSSLALVSAAVALTLYSLGGAANAGLEAGEMWQGLLVVMPLYLSAIAAATLSFVLAMVARVVARRPGALQVVTLVVAGVSVLVTCP